MVPPRTPVPAPRPSERQVEVSVTVSYCIQSNGSEFISRNLILIAIRQGSNPSPQPILRARSLQPARFQGSLSNLHRLGVCGFMLLENTATGGAVRDEGKQGH